MKGENMLDYILDDEEIISSKKRKKKTLSDLLDKYGSVEGIDKNADVRDSYDYMFANTDNLIDEVMAERNASSEQNLPETDDDFDEGFVRNTLRRTNPSVYRALKEKDKVAAMKISDENKHQYISCVGSQGGLGSSIVTLAGGAYKEAKDIYKKLSKPEERKKYGGSLGVLKDSAKDMKNNLYGAGYGLTYRQNGDCNSLLKRKIK